MSARLFIRNADGDLEEVPTFPTEGWTVEESAEEGNASQTAIVIPDPEAAYDFYSLRRAIIYEDESEDANQVLFSGFVGEHDIGRKEGEYVEIHARAWNLTLVDMNSLFDNRLQVGSDTDRPEETDVERITWVAGTEEMGYFDSLAFLSSDDPEDLDARDVAKTTSKMVFDESSQQSGKNYWIGATGGDGCGPDCGIFLWYGHDSSTDYESPLRLSNVPADWDDAELLDGTSLVWPVGFEDTHLHRTGERVYDGALIEYEGGSEYVKNPATTALFTLSGRDITIPAPEIKTAARARRRGQRMLADLDAMDEVVTTTVELPKGKVTKIRAGMRIAVRFSHLPGWENFGWARVLKCAVTPVHAGSAYSLTLDLQGPTSFVAVEGSELTLSGCNNVFGGGDITRDASDSDGSCNSGEVWGFTITNTSHDPLAFTEDFTILTGVEVVYHFDYDGSQGSDPYPLPFGPVTGSFVVPPGVTAEEFAFLAHANYGIGAVAGDECWSVVFERLS